MIWGTAEAHPSLALIKYWGKSDDVANTPATGSLAVTLKGLSTRTRVRLSAEPKDEVVVNGSAQPIQAYEFFLKGLKSALGWENRRIYAESINDFPTAAGLASSSSGFAALTGAAVALYQLLKTESDVSTTRRVPSPIPLPRLSSLARIGSGSATRSVWGGFTVFDAGSEAAEPVFDETHWPEFHVVVAVVDEDAKPVSSRAAMETSRSTSPYYGEWVRTSPELLRRAKAALAQRDWSALGPLVRQSYLRMFATMFTSEPPLLYWKPQSLAVIRELEILRAEGFNAWETMDAGPQVKIFCPEGEAATVVERLKRVVPDVRFLTTSPGPGLKLGNEETV